MVTRINYKKLGSEIPKDSDHMKYIETMGKALDAWKDENGERGYMIIACGEDETIAPQKGSNPSHVTGACCAVFVFGGNRENLASTIGTLMRGNDDFQKFLTLGAKGFTAKEVK